jgi:hypothetical protein
MDAILVFDEAESLFGSRADSMSSSTDRQVTAHSSEEMLLLAGVARSGKVRMKGGADARRCQPL